MLNRRQLIGYSAAAAAVATLPSVVAPTADAATGRLLFDASYATKSFTCYPDMNPNLARVGSDFRLVADPGNANRKVALFDASRRLTQGNTYPRASVTTGEVFLPGQEYWASVSLLMPTKIANGDWNSVFTPAFGRPWVGPSPLGIAFQPTARAGYNQLVFNRTASNGGVPMAPIPVQVGTWIQVIQHYQLATKAQGGFVEMWINQGPTADSWRRVVTRTPIDALAPGTLPTYKQYSSVGSYGVTPHRLYVGDHKVAQHDQRLVALNDFGTWNGRLPA